MIEQYIERYLEVGDIDHPKAYFRGTAEMFWGPLSFSGDVYQSVVYFGGMTATTIVGLGGSARHVISNQIGPIPDVWAGSTTPYLVEALSRAAEGLHLSDEHTNLYEQTTPWIGANGGLFATETATRYGCEAKPLEVLEFLAVKIMSGPPSDEDERIGSVVLGTPIYVARVTQPPKVDQETKDFWDKIQSAIGRFSRE